MSDTTPPELSIIIPAYKRADLLRITLANAQAATSKLNAEIIVIDDGSVPPLATTTELNEFLPPGVKFLHQSNEGSAVARWHGLGSARGEFIAFLDSDDLVEPEKYVRQLAAMRETGADLSYTDEAHWFTDPTNPAQCSELKPRPIPEGLDSLTLFLKLHPAPHNFVYHRRLFDARSANPWLPLRPLHRPVGDIWTLYYLAPFPTTVVKVPGMLTLQRMHVGDRYSLRWEATGIGSVAIMLEFMRRCPPTSLAAEARRRVADNALGSYRALPRGMPPPWETVLASIWRSLPSSELSKAGGRYFSIARCFLGLRAAVWLFRTLERPRYRSDENRIPLKQVAALSKELGRLAAELDASSPP